MCGAVVVDDGFEQALQEVRAAAADLQPDVMAAPLSHGPTGAPGGVRCRLDDSLQTISEGRCPLQRQLPVVVRNTLRLNDFGALGRRWAQ